MNYATIPQLKECLAKPTVASQIAGTIKQNLSNFSTTHATATTATPTTATPTTAASSSATPRGRGRPKGSLNKKTINAEFVTANAQSEKSATTATPRGPGSPKGSLNKYKKQSLSNFSEDILETIPSFTILMGQDEAMPRKDGRGRPKAEFDGTPVDIGLYQDSPGPH